MPSTGASWGGRDGEGSEESIERDGESGAVGRARRLAALELAVRLVVVVVHSDMLEAGDWDERRELDLEDVQESG